MEEFIKDYEKLKKHKEFIKDIDTNFFFEFADYMITKNNELEGMLKHVEKFRDQNLSSEIEYVIALKSSHMHYLKTDYISKTKVKELKEKVHGLLDYNAVSRGYQLIIDKEFEELLEE